MKTVRAFLLASPLLLAACGDGFELVKTDAMFPYGNQRTAGSGYAYVLAKMLPAKQAPILRAVTPRAAPRALKDAPEIVENTPALVAESAPESPAQDAETIFREQQEK